MSGDPRFLVIAAAAATSLLALVFLRTAWHKAADFTRFMGVLDDYRLVPEALVPTVARLLLGLEGVTVLLLALPWTTHLGAPLALALLVLYGAAIAVNLRRGRRSIECGCGGAAQPLSAALPIRNGVLAAAAIPPLLVDAPFVSPGEATAALASGVLLFVLFLVIEQSLVNDSHTRLIDNTLSGKGSPS